MPPPIAQTIRDTIYWQYAKLISKSACIGNQGRGFQMNRFLALRDGEIEWSTTLREWEKEREHLDECIYCEKQIELTTEHILPKKHNGPDTPENAIRVCKHCNLSKGDKRLYEWYGYERRDEIPRIAEGKYLKLLFDLHQKRGTLGVHKDDLHDSLCRHCDLRPLCEKAQKAEKLNIFCLEGIF
ncbi:HNH endonuclease [Patescibacteria group bacterium]|nr:HNH endonuclease [Patescibacteria group bacterium]